MLGSFTIRYFPSCRNQTVGSHPSRCDHHLTFCCMMMSRMHLTTPQALSMFRLICCPNSTGLNCWVPRMTWRELSLTLYRVTYPNLRLSAPARILYNFKVRFLSRIIFLFSNLHCPLGELAGVILQLVGEAGSRLGAELLSPVHVAAVTRVPLIESL